MLSCLHFLTCHPLCILHQMASSSTTPCKPVSSVCSAAPIRLIQRCFVSTVLSFEAALPVATSSFQTVPLRVLNCALSAEHTACFILRDCPYFLLLRRMTLGSAGLERSCPCLTASVWWHKGPNLLSPKAKSSIVLHGPLTISSCCDASCPVSFLQITHLSLCGFSSPSQTMEGQGLSLAFFFLCLHSQASLLYWLINPNPQI